MLSLLLFESNCVCVVARKKNGRSHAFSCRKSIEKNNNYNYVTVIATALWPENVQHLDVSSNCFSSNKCLFPLTVLSSLRSLQSNPIVTPTNIAPNLFFAWIAHSFRFIESVDGDPIIESFVATFRPMVDTIYAEKLGKLAKFDEKYYKDLRLVEKHSGKIEHRLSCLSDALIAYRDAIPTKDAKKEIVKRFHEICTSNSKMVKTIKKSYTLLSDFSRALSKYRIACDMESCQTFQIRDASSEEIAMIAQALNYKCSMKNSYSIIIKSCSIIGDVTKIEPDHLFILEKDPCEKLFDLRTIIHLLDRHTRSDYIQNSVHLIRDFEILKKQAKDKTTVFFVPLVLSKMTASRGLTKFIDDDGLKTSSDMLVWSDVNLVAVLAVEIQPSGQLTTDQLRHMDQFEESYNEQLKKLNEMNIKLDVKEEKHQKRSEDPETSIEAINSQTSKIRKVSDFLANLSNLNGRACDKKLPFDWFTTRNPLEISLAYFDFKPIKEINELMIRLTALELCDQKLTKLAGIQDLNCRHLRIHRNQIKSLKGIEFCVQLETLFINDNALKDRTELELLKTLPKLTHLDMSANPISATEGYRSKVMQSAQFLISLDRQIIPLEERHVNTMKLNTRGLSLELIEKICPQWKNKKELMICDQKIEQIILEKSQVEELSHVRLIDLSKNKLASVREISALNITNLILNNNCLKTIAVTDGQVLQPFQSLESLEISNNSINNTIILRMGIPLLLKLKFIKLSSNALSR
uniref:Uncharacterized protein n=1 Tax=Caenorhabditis japonica TaxID=281687 RepID=A0A8R1HM27_CAEJA